jgi:hypothetical protein
MTKFALRGPTEEWEGVFSVLPVGTEHLSKSTGNMQLLTSGAAESAALCPDLALVIIRWPKLTPHAKATIMGIARTAKRKR